MKMNFGTLERKTAILWISAVALILVLWGLLLIGQQILPRVGYAKTDAAHPAQWWCKRGKT